MTSREKILAAIDDCDDRNMRTLLLLVHGGFDELSDKIDFAISSEEALRKEVKQAVLNGHSDPP